MRRDAHHVRARGGLSRTRIDDIEPILRDRLSCDTTDSSDPAVVAGAGLMTAGLVESPLTAITAELRSRR